MGRKDKYKLGQSRNSSVFKVVGGKAGKVKGKPQEVSTKLKKLVPNKKSSVQDLDTKLDSLRKQSALSLSGKPEPSSKKTITGGASLGNAAEVDMDSLVNSMETTTTKMSKKKSS